MTAHYLVTNTQRDVLAQLESADRAAPNFFVEAPLVIDCRNDGAAFAARVSESQQQTLSDGLTSGDLRYVSELLRPVKDYAVKRAAEGFRELDSHAA